MSNPYAPPPTKQPTELEAFGLGALVAGVALAAVYFGATQGFPVIGKALGFLTSAAAVAWAVRTDGPSYRTRKAVGFGGGFVLALLVLGTIGIGRQEPVEAVDNVPTAATEKDDVVAQLAAIAESIEVPAVDETPVEVPPLPPGESYRLDVVATAGKYSVDFEVSTNIPGSIVVMASLKLQGQTDTDVAIGESKRMALTDGVGRGSIDTFEIPTGVYDVEVAFYPQWGFADRLSQATAISEPIGAWAEPLRLIGNEMPAADFQFRENGRRWAMDNLDRFLPSFWDERFGPTETQRRASGEKVYYFSRLDMTVITEGGSAIRFRMGRDRFGAWEPL